MIKSMDRFATSLEGFKITEMTVFEWLSFWNEEPAYFFELFEEAPTKEAQKARDYYLYLYEPLSSIHSDKVTYLGDNYYSLDGRGVSGDTIVMLINSRE